jgi:hypothetical protein
VTQPPYAPIPGKARTRALARRDDTRRSAKVSGGHTEREAWDLWCPHARVEGNNKAYNNYHKKFEYDGCRCRASKCSAWRWLDDERGFCGLAGRP